MAEVTELVTKFSFEGDLAPLDDYNSGLTDSISLMAGTVAGIAALSGAFSALALSIFETIDPLVQLQRETNVSVERLQTLGFVASVSGSSLDAVTSSIRGLEQTIGEAATKGSEDFARLGISVRDFNGEIKTADAVLEEVGRRFRSLNLSLSQQRAFAQSLGIDASLLQLLNRTAEEMSELEQRARDFGIVTKEQGDIIVDTNDAITTSKFAFQALQQQIVLGIGPDIKALADFFTELIVENGEFVKAIAEKTITVLSALTDSLERLAPALGFLASAFVAAKVAGVGFAGIIAIITSPIIIWTVAITGALLILDDLIVAFRGGQSVIADFFQTFLGIDIAPILHGMVDGVRLLIDALVESFDWWVSLFTRIYDNVSDVIGLIGDFVGIGDSDVNVNNTMTQPAAVIGAGSNVTVSQDTTINITAANADEARIGVEEALQRQLRDAEDVMRRGN